MRLTGFHLNAHCSRLARYLRCKTGLFMRISFSYLRNQPTRIASLVLALGTLLGSPTFAGEHLPKFPQEAPYSTIRQSLLKMGWSPFISTDADECSKFDTRCKGRPEMLSCSGTGEAPCMFVWKKNETIIEIVTIGEETVFDNMRCREGC